MVSKNRIGEYITDFISLSCIFLAAPKIKKYQAPEVMELSDVVPSIIAVMDESVGYV